MKAPVLGLALLAAVTAFSLLPTKEAATPAQHAPFAVVPGPVPPAAEWSVQAIPTDGWEDGPTALPMPSLPPLESPLDDH